MYPMYGIPKPFNDTCHGHGNMALKVEEALNRACRFFQGYFRTIMAIDT